MTEGVQLKSEEMKSMASHLKELEMLKPPTMAIMAHTNIVKVLKRVSELEEIPGEREHRIKERAASLYNSWTFIDIASEDFISSPPKNPGEAVKPCSMSASSSPLEQSQPSPETGSPETRKPLQRARDSTPSNSESSRLKES